MRFRYLYVCREPDSTVITTKNKGTITVSCGRTCIKIDTHQALLPRPVTKGVFLG